MIGPSAKEYLRDDLRSMPGVLWKIDGVPRSDLRRPLTGTGTNLLGLIKHLALWESRYLGEVFGRPSSEPMPRCTGTLLSDRPIPGVWQTLAATAAQCVPPGQ